MAFTLPALGRQALGLSALAGLRSLSPIAVLSFTLAHQPLPQPGQLTQRLTSSRATLVLAALAAAELLGDKLPMAPARTTAPPLIGRAVIGGAISALLWDQSRAPAWQGALAGGATAVGSTFASYHARRLLGKWLKLPDPLIAVAEDTLVGLSAWQLRASLRRSLAQGAARNPLVR